MGWISARLAKAPLLAAMMAMLGAGVQAAVSDPITERLDHYFGYGFTKPETYRVLSGMGDPEIMPDFDWLHMPSPVDDLVYTFLHDLWAEFGGQYSSNCRIDYAMETLRARVDQFGSESAYVAQWIKAQRAVFSACLSPARGTKALPEPAPVGPELVDLQAYDRAYQAASLLFYRGDRAAARAGFGVIAASRSPHAAIAAYMSVAIGAGSTAGTTTGWEVARPLVPSEQSLVEIAALLADPKLADIHPMAEALRGWLGQHRQKM